MATNKQNITTAVVAIALVGFIAWAFFDNISSANKEQAASIQIPEKAVMEHAREINASRLEILAREGQVAPGMTMAQVRIALGEPSRSLVDSSGSQIQTVWWYESKGQDKMIYFGSDGKITKIKQ